MKKWPGRLSLIVLGLISGIAACELLLALFYPQDIRRIRQTPHFFGKYDPEIGWVNKENSSGFQRTADGAAAYIEINAGGLRGKEFSYSKPPGKKRIVVLGDSITFGYGLDESQTYPFMLQEMLGDGFEVINAAVVGYGTDQQYLFFRREGIKYNPDVVIVGFSAGDVFDSTCSMRHGFYKPFFTLANRRLRLMNTPVPEKIPLKEIFFHDGPVRAFIFGNSHLFRLLFYRFADISRALSISREEMNVFEGLEVVKEIIGSMKGECAERHCDLLFVVIPQENWIAASFIDKDFSRRGHSASVNILEELDIAHIDLWGPFMENYRAGLFQEGDPVHTNRSGNKIIAEEIFRALTAPRDTGGNK